MQQLGHVCVVHLHNHLLHLFMENIPRDKKAVYLLWGYTDNKHPERTVMKDNGFRYCWKKTAVEFDVPEDVVEEFVIMGRVVGQLPIVTQQKIPLIVMYIIARMAPERLCPNWTILTLPCS